MYSPLLSMLSLSMRDYQPIVTDVFGALLNGWGVQFIMNSAKRPLLPGHDSVGKSQADGGGGSPWTKLKNSTYLFVALLTIQQASMPLMARATRDRKADETFITTVGVFFMDAIKLAACSAILIVKEGSFSRFSKNVRSAFVDDALETAKVGVPSLIYVLQNNLYYVALSNLESTTFCVLYQLKILVTALMMRLILGKPLSAIQWTSLVILAVGVADVQLQYEPPHARSAEIAAQQSALYGFMVVVVLCLTSGFAGVYLEKILKQSRVNILMQNIRLAAFGILISTITMLFKDVERIRRDGFLVGFDGLTWLMIVTNSVGGLLISLVIKYADNISKAYAQSMAIVGAALGSWLLFSFTPNLMFMFGAGLVIVSIYLYSAYPHRTT